MILDFLSALHPATLPGEEISLFLSQESEDSPLLGIDDSYIFHIYLRKPHRKIGYISLRMGESPALYYLGHIGYRIDAPYRGHGYAAKACELLLPFMAKMGLASVCITADPDNAPSRKTCERIGCELESIVSVPLAYRYACANAQQKCRYILSIPRKA